MLDPKKMYIAMHLGGDSDFKKRFIQNSIKIWTQSEYCHCELIFPKIIGDKNSFSASGFEGRVRFKNILYTHPERWHFIEIPIMSMDRTLQAIHWRAQCIDGLPYDYKMIVFSFVLPFRRDDPFKYCCSEACAFTMDFLPFKITPKQIDIEACKIFANKRSYNSDWSIKKEFKFA